MAGTFPSWRYGPEGQAGIFASTDDVPAGWEDHPSKVGHKAKAEKPAPRPKRAAK